jgi:glutamate carboxypeptidase
MALHETPARSDIDPLIDDLRTLVECESPSSDPVALDRSADLVARLGTARLGVEPERLGIHLRWRLGGPTRELVLGSLDDRTGVTLLVTGDEEIGSPSSRTLIEDEARGADAVLGTTVTPATAVSGTTGNTVPTEASFAVDVRARTDAGRDADTGADAGASTAASLSERP